MKKRILLSFLIVGIFIISFTFAQAQGVGKANQNSQAQISAFVEDPASGIYTNEQGKQIKIQRQEKNKFKLESEGVSVDCECNLTQERTKNKTKLKTKLSNGKNAEIKIMPNTASETALKRLRLKVCSEANNCSIVLKEVGKNNEIKLAYEVKAQKQSRVLWLFKKRMQVQSQINAETGKIIRVKKPWWAFLAKEDDE